MNQTVEKLAEQNTNLKMLSGVHTGQVKWFNRRRGYGFIKIIQTRESDEEGESFIGKDVFVHQSHIRPKVSSYRSLEENEYVELGLSVDEKNTTQAVNVTGILGGSLLCDVQNERPMRSGQFLSSHEESQDGEGYHVPKYNQRNRNRPGRFRRNDTSEDTEQADENRGSQRGNYFSNLESH